MCYLHNYCKNRFEGLLMIRIIVGCVLMFASVGAEPRAVSFDQLMVHATEWTKATETKQESSQLVDCLAAYHDTSVSIRGFLIPPSSEAEPWYFSSQPSLKSCCIAADKRAGTLIPLQSYTAIDANTGNRAVTLVGRLKVAPARDANGVLVQLYRLEGASLLPEPVDLQFPVLPTALVILAGGAIVAYVALRGRKVRYG
jgi:hypothetical protein